jgi:hypothetical protein
MVPLFATPEPPPSTVTRLVSVAPLPEVRPWIVVFDGTMSALPLTNVVWKMVFAAGLLRLDAAKTVVSK